MARRASKKVLEFAGERSGELQGESRQAISEGDIARRAYEIYRSRGGGDGLDMDDWLQAERELLAKMQ